MQFRDFFENQKVNLIVSLAKQARQIYGICDRAKFGDCNDTVKETLILLKQYGIQAKSQGGYFITNPNSVAVWPGEEDEPTPEEWEHTWISIQDDAKKDILDPTIDQFYSSLDFDLMTKAPGIYYSHPLWDGDAGLLERYKYWN